MVLPHTEAIKQGVLAGLGVAFVSVYAIRGEQATGRVRSLRVRGLQIVRHFHLIHHERRRPSAAARAFMELFATAAPARSGPGWRGPALRDATACKSPAHSRGAPSRPEPDVHRPT
jgi:hypothetical protein